MMMNAQGPLPADKSPPQKPPFPDAVTRSEPGLRRHRTAIAPPASKAEPRAQRPVLACINGTPNADAVVRHARILADALGEPLVLLQVRERPGGNCPADPIEWAIAQREASARLEALARSAGEAACGTEIVLRHGWAPDAIVDAARSLSAGLIVLGTADHPRQAGTVPGGLASMPYLGLTASHVLACSGHCVLLHPPADCRSAAEPYRRILVPLDGSCWAEAALPMAIQLARSSGAELLLAHVVSQPRLTGQQLPEAEDLHLLEQLVCRNERAGRLYLDRMRRAIADHAVKVDTVTFRSTDPRAGLAELIGTADFDLVVLSARGEGAIDGADMPYGSTVGYLAGRFPVSMLVVRPDQPCQTNGARHAGRLPARPRALQPR